MKNVWKKNQIIITALVLMVGVAGYLNFTDKSISETWNWDEVSEVDTTKEKATEEKANTEQDKKKKEKKTAETKEEENVGEAVLTSSSKSQVLYSAKLAREQTRAENKEMLTEIINNANATEEQKNKAINAIMEMADCAEKENAAETLLSAKGYENAVVSIEDGNVDVVIDKASLSQKEITQIEDIVKRKTGVEMEKIVISTGKGE